MPRPQAKRSKAQKGQTAAVHAQNSGQTTPVASGKPTPAASGLATPAENWDSVSGPGSPLDLSKKVQAMETALNAANKALAQRDTALQAAEEKSASLHKALRVE